MRRVEELDGITDLRDAQRQRMEQLRRQRLDEFMAGFSAITMKLKEMYQNITIGGDAELELVDSLDPFSEGIVFRWIPTLKSSSLILLQRMNIMCFLVCDLATSRGRTSRICLEVRRRSVHLHSCSLYTTTNPLHSTSWTRLTLHSTSRTSQLSLTTSK